MMGYRSLAGWLHLSYENSTGRATQAKDGRQAGKVACTLKKSTKEGTSDEPTVGIDCILINN